MQAFYSYPHGCLAIFLLIWLRALPGTGQTSFQRFAPAAITELGLTPNIISFHPNGKEMIVSAYAGDFDEQYLYHSVREGDQWGALQLLEFAGQVYNGCFSQDGKWLIYGKKKEASGPDDFFEVFLVPYDGMQWGQAENLSAQYGIQGGYFCLLPNRNLYYYSYNPQTDQGGIFMSRWVDGSYSPPQKLAAAINASFEFSPYVNATEDRMLFSRYVEGDPVSSGIYVSQNINGEWQEAEQLPLIPYSWGMTVSPERDMYFLNGITFQYMRVPLSELGIGFE